MAAYGSWAHFVSLYYVCGSWTVCGTGCNMSQIMWHILAGFDIFLLLDAAVPTVDIPPPSTTPGLAFIETVGDQLDPWINDQLKITLLPTVFSLKLRNFVFNGMAELLIVDVGSRQFGLKKNRTMGMNPGCGITLYLSKAITIAGKRHICNVFHWPGFC